MSSSETSKQSSGASAAGQQVPTFASMKLNRESRDLVWSRIEKMLEVYGPMEVTARSVKDSKSREMEKHYHSLIGDIAKHYVHFGRKFAAKDMKRLMIDAFRYDTYHDPDLRPEWDKMGAIRLVPAINHDGFVTMGEQSRKFTKKLASAFIEWLIAFMADNKIPTSDKRYAQN